MNKFTAVVTGIEKTDIVTYITLECNDIPVRLIKTKTPVWAGVGDSVYFTFQEASVCVSRDCPCNVSIENRIPATLQSVRRGESLCELTFESDMGRVVALITAHAYDDIGLAEGCKATILIRGIDINVEPQLIPTRLDELSNIIYRTKDAKSDKTLQEGN